VKQQIKTSPTNFVGTWIPDVPDHRDRLYVPRIAKIVQPTKVDRITYERKVENQKSLGSCTGNSVTTVIESELGLSYELSRLMCYYNGREIDGTLKSDAGAQIRSVIKGALKVGVCSETTWPYKVSKFATVPNSKAYSEAQLLISEVNKKKLKYQRVSDLNGLLDCLANGHPVVFGFVVPASFDFLSGEFLQPLPKKTEKSLGGHAVVAGGYDLTAKKPFIWVQNSWGPEWGLEGWFKLPITWFTDTRRLVDDMWCLK
jgi:C1A family cysteine protease